MKKFLILACFAMFSFIVFGSNVNAAEYNIGGYTVETEMTEPFSYIIYETVGKTNLALFGSAKSGYTGSFVDFKTNDKVNQLIYVANANCHMSMFILNNGKWILDSANTGTDVDIVSTSSITFAYGVMNIIDSTENVTKADGTVVFQAPPVNNNPTLVEILKGAQVAGTTTVATMKTITIVAVSCLALLIGLHLLPKILYRFL